VPPEYRARFRGRRRLLESHRGYDPGALVVARDFARAFGAPLYCSTVSRLVVELNRSPGHPMLLSAAMLPLSAAERDALLARYYLPYWRSVEREVAAALRQRLRTVHLSCHSFTPSLKGVRRNADVGLLYDPRCPQEAALCRRWQEQIRQRSDVRVRRNYPYRGDADSLTTSLRRRFSGRPYLGIQLELNQRFARQPAARWRRLRETLVKTFAAALHSKEC
jgi:predicted N-formylglutamate amidohydrolase